MQYSRDLHFHNSSSSEVRTAPCEEPHQHSQKFVFWNISDFKFSDTQPGIVITCDDVSIEEQRLNTLGMKEQEGFKMFQRRKVKKTALRN